MLRDVYGIILLGILGLKETWKEILEIFIWPCWVFIATRGFSLVAASGGYSLVAMWELLTAVASLIAERGL